MAEMNEPLVPYNIRITVEPKPHQLIWRWRYTVQYEAVNGTWWNAWSYYHFSSGSAISEKRAKEKAKKVAKAWCDEQQKKKDHQE